MADRPLLIIVLAAGKGTRMRSDMPKVLHAIAGRSMLGHVLALARSLPENRVATVIGPDMDSVRAEASRHAPGSPVFVQSEQRGTADAVLAAREALDGHDGDVMVLYADTPLIRRETLVALSAALAEGAGIAVLGFEAEDPTGYGRLLTDEAGRLVAIREDKDASDEERQIRLCNSGVMAFGRGGVTALLQRIGNDNAKGEFYLTDAVEIARGDGRSAAVVVCPEREVIGVNARDQLAMAEGLWQVRARAAVMQSGVTMIAPETVWLAFDTVFGRDVVIEPNVFFGPGVRVGARVSIKANCHLEGHDAKSGAGLVIDDGAVVGPFARLRPGARIGADAHIGNFVEIKNAVMGAGSKANHLSYVGDADVGAKCNIGAGTIFCNYDGFNKARSTLGSEVFIGSNSALVAPVVIGDGAYVAAGSTISRNVNAGALAIERAGQVERAEWAIKYRAVMAKQKP